MNYKQSVLSLPYTHALFGHSNSRQRYIFFNIKKHFSKKNNVFFYFFLHLPKKHFTNFCLLIYNDMV